jgi:hypothetical protein
LGRNLFPLHPVLHFREVVISYEVQASKLGVSGIAADYGGSDRSACSPFFGPVASLASTAAPRTVKHISRTRSLENKPHPRSVACILSHIVKRISAFFA